MSADLTRARWVRAARRQCVRLAALVLLTGVVSTGSAGADSGQSGPADTTSQVEAPGGCEGLRKGTNEWAGLAGAANAMSIKHSKAQRQFVMQALSWGRTLSRPKGPGFFCGQLEALVEVVPVFVMFQSDRPYGFGITPLFFRWNFGTSHRIQPFVEIAGGLLRTDRAVPENTRRRNFTAQSGLGFRVMLNERRAWIVGYRLHHISNAGPGKTNPSVNSNFFYTGLSILR